MNLLLAYDGSEHADAAIDDLRVAGLPDDTHAVVLSVAQTWVPVVNTLDDPALAELAFEDVRRRAIDALEDSRKLSQRAAEKLRAHFPRWKIQPHAVADSAAQAMIQKSQQWPADLVVLGSRGRSTVARILLGSVSTKVLHHVNCSVRIVHKPARFSDLPPRILVGVDASAGAKAAVKAVAARRWPAGSAARAVAALEIGPWDAIAAPLAIAGTAAEKWGQDTVARAAKTLQDAGLITSTVVRGGDPRHVLVEEAQTWDASCIFVGARGLGRFERFLLGSVSTSVAQHATCAVEIVHSRPPASKPSPTRRARRPKAKPTRKKSPARRPLKERATGRRTRRR